jgi:hypothetical protein
MKFYEPTDKLCWLDIIVIVAVICGFAVFSVGASLWILHFMGKF